MGRTLIWKMLLVCTFVLAGCQSNPKSDGEVVVSGQSIDSLQHAASQPQSLASQPSRTIAYQTRPLVLYFLADDIFKRPRTEIPYYRNGEIVYLEEHAFRQHDEGHQPWKANGIDVVTAGSSNLTGEDLPFEEAEILYRGKMLKTKSGIVLRRITNENVEMTVPGIGKYKFYLTAPEGTSILFIRKIMLYPEVVA